MTASPQVIQISPQLAPRRGGCAADEIEYLLEYPPDSGSFVKGCRNVGLPTLELYQPTSGTANGTAVVVCPGGGFRILAWEHEGTDVAEWLNACGVTVFLLKYRLRPTPPDPQEFAAENLAQSAAIRKDHRAWLNSIDEYRRAAICDGRQGIEVVRRRAHEWGISPDRVGLLGFSAGGCLTMGVLMEDDPVSRPNFAACIYGLNPDRRPVPKSAPPLFVVATQADLSVPVNESMLIYTDWTAAGIPAELHVFRDGPHGFGMRKFGLPVDHWPRLFEHWLGAGGWLKA
jgi:acetyl esterase/lipase